MAIIFTKHAEEMLIHRTVKKARVKACIENPDKILPGRDNAKIYLKDFGKDYLRLVVVKQAENFIIVTLHWLAKKRIQE